MRVSCLDCARKHIAQAAVLIDESVLGYPTHRWRAVGHLAEAESELTRDYLYMAQEIRGHRVAYIGDKRYDVPIDQLIATLTEIASDKEKEELPSA